MMIRCAVPLCCLLAFTAAPLAAQGLRPVTPVPPVVPARHAKPDPKNLGLMALLKKSMDGQPVIAVGTGGYGTKEAYDEDAFQKAAKLRERLQVIAEAASSDRRAYIPFLVRNAWVIAPETREEPHADFAGLTATDIAGLRVQLDRVVTTLTPEQMRQAGTDEGIPVSRLSAESQRALALSVRPPMQLTVETDTPVKDPQGVTRTGRSHKEVGKITEPLDWSQVRFRARLKIEGATFQAPGSNSLYALGKREDGLPTLYPATGTESDMAIPVYDTVPNTFKPTDLDGRPYTKPIGFRGVFTVKEVLSRLQPLTGLHLSAFSWFEVAPVFLGSENLTCGEVLDGLRLGVTGAWRRVGNTYILTFDRRGLAALRLSMLEATVDLAAQAKKLSDDTREAPGWLDVALKMPFANDDPLALTDEQRRQMYDMPGWKPGASQRPDYPQGVKIAFSQMTVAQQDFLRRAAEKETMPVSHWGTSQPDEQRPYTANDVESACLSNEMYPPAVDITLWIPGHGWVRVGGHDLHWTYLMRVRNKLDAAAWEKQYKEREATTPTTWKPETHRSPANSRALMVPVLGPARVAELAQEMKRHGLTTLFYPLVSGGYATFPSKAFPLHPALRGEDGWAATAKSMKAAGVKVIGYLSPIAWQNEGMNVHWLDKHRDWLDVDALGRTRLEWIATHKDVGGGGFENFIPRVSYVRPAEPEVAHRLDALVDEASHLPNIAGLLVLDWTPARARETDAEERGLLPPLGYALGDRLASIAATGHDPLDDIPLNTSIYSAWRPPDILYAMGDYPDVGERENLYLYPPLASRVLQRARERRKDWTTYLLDEPFADERSMQRRYTIPGQPPKDDRPKADVMLSINPTIHEVKYDGFTVPIPDFKDWAARGWPKNVSEYPTLAVMNDAINSWTDGKPPAKLVVYDFRDVPGEITASLPYIPSR